MSHYIKPYEFRFEGKGCNRRIYTIFRDYQRDSHEVEITEEVYLELLLSNRYVQNATRSDTSHKECWDFSEEQQARRGAATHPSAEDEALRHELGREINLAFRELLPTQARRYLLAHRYGYSYAEIARMEGCTTNAIRNSLVATRKKLQEILRKNMSITPSEFPKE